MDVIQNQRRWDFGQPAEKSFLNCIEQFAIPSWTSVSGNLLGVQFSADKTKVMFMQNGQSSTTPDFQKRIRVYENSNPTGMIQATSDLTYIGQTPDLTFEVGGVRQQVSSAVCFYCNEALGKLWVLAGNIHLAEYDFNLSTLATSLVQYKTLDYNVSGGMFYFSGDGMKLYTSNSGLSDNFAVYNLSSAFDVSTVVLDSVTTLGIPTGDNCSCPPSFYGNGSYAIYLSYYGGSGQVNINKRQFATPYSFLSVISGTGYRQGMRRSGYGNIRTIGQLPIFLSENRLYLNYFNNSSSPQRIGFGEFDITTNFRGDGDELGGVKDYNGTIIPFAV